MNHFHKTRHPWASLVFLLPLLALYEGGVLAFGGATDGIRNGADVWFRWTLGRYGIENPWFPPLLIVVILLFRSVLSWRDRPKDLLATSFGTAVECLVYSVLLWMIARNFPTILGKFMTMNVTFQTPATTQVITFLGAGIYEELMFRMILFSASVFLLRLALVPRSLALLLAGIAGSLLFAAAHHFGPSGEEVVTSKFLFRTAAGLYFTALYVLRGFGTAVGTHAAYDVLVGVAVA